MSFRATALIAVLFQLSSLQFAMAEETPKLTEEQSAQAEKQYQQYCTLCHGAEREGYANDQAPSLRSQSLMESGWREMFQATAYGRPGTPMSGYFEEVGGPLTQQEIWHLVMWLAEQENIEPIWLERDAIEGDIVAGQEIYEAECSICHGDSGEGGAGTALGNPGMLAMTSDPFIRYAIENGRQGTDMPAFIDDLSSTDIDNVTAFIRSKATGWEMQKPVLREPPSVAEYVLNPDGEDPEFELQDGLYVSADALNSALEGKRKMVLLDTRAMSSWQVAHIAGSVPLPYYYEDTESLAEDLPKDGTWIVTYCNCPRAAAEHVNKKLMVLGFTNLAVLWEGISGWVALGYPVAMGKTVAAETAAAD